MATVKNLEKLIADLKRQAARLAKKPRDVVVGCSQAYAVFVHENLEAHHEVGQAKFLEQPARELQPVLRQEIRDNVRKGVELEKALLLAGLHLQREAQKLTPVDTGALRASFFTDYEDNLEAAAAEARSRGDERRENVQAKRDTKTVFKRLKGK